ncbi:hypothetical protein D9C73_028371 [Collichthys lucidus]|uniref:Uncharacterized protein n=1 Tax=Collichthys lucidus TaxID=240159 RepID=A0A4U5TWQ9_COLLU|nr:hypothetical protein D9C73_028371 [Collichthys lucidus]
MKHCVREAKDSYRRQVEQKLRENSMQEIWEGVRTITGHNKETRATGGAMERANELNNFFNRFNQLMPPLPLLCNVVSGGASPQRTLLARCHCQHYLHTHRDPQDPPIITDAPPYIPDGCLNNSTPHPSTSPSPLFCPSSNSGPFDFRAA